MEASTLLLVPRFPVWLPKSHSINRPLLFTPGKSNSHHSTALQCHKMYVPGYGASPETNAAKHLHDFFTYIAVKIVYAQLLSCNKEGYYDLMQFLENHSLSDGGDKFCADLMRESSRHKSLALRILEVRSAYCKADFEWDNLKRLSTKMVEERNAIVMREYVSETSPVKTKSEK